MTQTDELAAIDKMLATATGDAHRRNLQRMREDIASNWSPARNHPNSPCPRCGGALRLTQPTGHGECRRCGSKVEVR